MNLIIRPPGAWVQFPAMVKYFNGSILAYKPAHSEPAWHKMAQSPLNAPLNLWTVRRKAEV